MLASNEQPNAEDYIHQLGQQARHAARGLANATTEQKNTALTVAAKVLRRNGDALLEANARDLVIGTHGRGVFVLDLDSIASHVAASNR